MKKDKPKKETKVSEHTVYKVGGKRVPGVTTVLNNLGWKTRGLMYWAAAEVRAGNDPFAVRDKAADVGTLAHAMIEEHITGDKKIDEMEYSPNDMEMAKLAYNAYVKWEKQHEVKPVGSEIQLVSKEHKFGGTLDLVAKVDGVPSLVDFKTSKAMYPDHVIQLAAYQELWRENNDGEVLEPHLLRVSKIDGSFHHHQFESLDAAWEAFLACLVLHDLKKEIK